MTCQLMEKLSELISNERNEEASAALKNVDPRYLINDSGASLLHIAAEQNNVSMVEYLLDLGLDVDLQDKRGTTALILAIKKSYYKIINAILKFNPNLHIQNDIEKKSTLKLLIDELFFGNPKINIEKVYEVLKRECQGDNEQIAMRLVNVKCPLHTAVRFRKPRILRIMLKKGYSVNERKDELDWTPLHIAFQLHDLPCAMVLLKNGANVDATSYVNDIPFYYYRQFQDSDLEVKVVKIILRRSKTVKRQFYKQLAYLLENGKNKALQAVLEYKFDFRSVDGNGETALHYLARNPTLDNDQELIELLSTKKLDINQVNCNGRTALFIAALNGSSNLLKFLLDHSANIPLITKITELTVLKLLDEKSVSKVDNYYKCVKLLLQHNFDPQVFTENGRKVFNSIVDQENSLVIKLILTHLAIRQARNFSISKLVQAQIDSDCWLSKRFTICKLQLDRFKKIKMTEFMTLFEFMCKSDEEIVFCLRNDELFTALKVIGEIHKNKSDFFDIFWGYLEKPLAKAQVRKNAVQLICDITGFSYHQHHVILDGILKYFNKKDLDIYKNEEYANCLL